MDHACILHQSSFGDHLEIFSSPFFSFHNLCPRVLCDGYLKKEFHKHWDSGSAGINCIALKEARGMTD